uniref:Tetratricopeptide repeat protein n=1 Tax=Amphora coffeiformis TaxID=265554 RepID=A0A7S3P7M3_9STRA|mmetsp:Transcript_8113/g.15686  ORF Transcript_8113/g.15686 Transcript_8113/m.15686 type:complete len:411 (-) Transcript_8113:32-1264(-)|eukprot:scaffold2179_cov165-Amphora_coffeaeformis.AAC.9
MTPWQKGRVTTHDKTSDFRALNAELDRVVAYTDPVKRKQALASIWENVRDEKDDAWGMYLKGRMLMILGKPPPFCLMYLQKAIQMDPKLHQAMTTVGLLLRLAKQLPDALTMLRRAEDTAREDREASNFVKAACAADLGGLLQVMGDNEAAEEAFRRALAEDADCWPAYTSLAVLHEKNDSIEEAMATLKDAIDRLPEPAAPSGYTKEQTQCLFAAGVLATRRNEWNEALSIFTKAYEANPVHWNILSKIIQCYAAMGNMEERDSTIRKLYILVMQGKVPSDRYCREQISTEHGNILVFEMFQLAYESGKPVLFMQWEKTSPLNSPQMVSFGSNEGINRIQREAGQVPEGYRLYHIDAHGLNGAHCALEFILAQKKPPYDRVRQTMLDGMLQPMPATGGSLPTVDTFNLN